MKNYKILKKQKLELPEKIISYDTMLSIPVQWKKYSDNIGWNCMVGDKTNFFQIYRLTTKKNNVDNYIDNLFKNMWEDVYRLLEYSEKKYQPNCCSVGGYKEFGLNFKDNKLVDKEGNVYMTTIYYNPTQIKVNNKAVTINEPSLIYYDNDIIEIVLKISFIFNKLN